MTLSLQVLTQPSRRLQSPLGRRPAVNQLRTESEGVTTPEVPDETSPDGGIIEEASGDAPDAATPEDEEPQKPVDDGTEDGAPDSQITAEASGQVSDADSPDQIITDEGTAEAPDAEVPVIDTAEEASGAVDDAADITGDDEVEESSGLAPGDTPSIESTDKPVPDADEAATPGAEVNEPSAVEIPDAATPEEWSH
ncbi:hypothetical protein FJT64_005736 [Amphibalanus amphitrite]|uniref:Uncharacterized protein n=1 Tax=Amphibalanus amphitrite TaxID=1232801 RepID=A0A6A4VZL6_AMPAM|nr:hypothetical protein FJT64_005736 [Amphibalanus amphitrite]